MPAPLLSETALQELALAASEVRERAHAPYSQFHVGAAVLDEQGRVHLGVNVENAAYPNGICAETAAIAAMVLAGGKQIVAIGVAGGGDALCTPCGGCRQRIREFSTPETVVAIAGGGVLRRVKNLAELLPESFGPENLTTNRSQAK